MRATRRHILALAALVALAPALAGGQEVALPDPVVAPEAGDGTVAEIVDPDRQLDLANVVTSAAKGVTTVQEAPAIITIITAEEIKARGFQYLQQALATVPGWSEGAGVGNQVQAPVVRGTFQAALFLQDGVAMFDPYGNIPWSSRTFPLETVKRLEVVTGPGGVLWGANSYLGIVNVIMKDAEDVNGVEATAQYGDGPGDKEHFRVSAQLGKTFFAKRLKIYQHVSYESFLGPTWNAPTFIASSPAPQPTGPAFYGANASDYYKPYGSDPGRSWFVNVSGKYTFGPVTLTYRIPVGNLYSQLVFANAIVPNSIANIYDRYAVLEYKDRFWRDRFGITVKGYYTQFVRNFSIQLFPQSALFPGYAQGDGSWNIGGLHFEFPTQLVQRAGGTLDMDLNLPHGFRLLFGGEVFFESLTGSTDTFPSHLGVVGNSSPLNTAGALPLVCPQHDDGSGRFVPVPGCPRPFLYDVSRIVGALYANLQYRPIQRLTLDAGVRLQKGFGQRPYDFVPLYSAAVVWNFARSWHLKANYTTGFRPTVFTNTDAVPGGVNFGANPNLKPETSQSFQGEINARLLRGVRRVRELELRLDYSYTFLDKLLVLRSGSYANSGQRAIHSVEALGKLYLTGQHFVTASYTYLYATTSDVGVVRTVPNHNVALGASFNLVKDLLDVNTNLVVTGAYADPNRVPTLSNPIPGATTGARATDLTFDRLTPVALLNLGFRLHFLKDRLGVSGQFYNVLNQRYWLPDAFYDLTPSIEMTPNPAPGFSFMSTVTGRL